MIRLLLLRHAKAARPTSGRDKDRALEKRGRSAAARMGGWMRNEGLIPDFALVSDARRTRETFTYAAKEFVGPTDARDEPRIYEASADSLLRLLVATDPRVRTLLLVGHNPGVADLALLLTGAGDRSALARMRLKFPPGTIAQLSFEGVWHDLNWGSAQLVRFVTPASLGDSEEENSEEEN